MRTLLSSTAAILLVAAPVAAEGPTYTEIDLQFGLASNDFEDFSQTSVTAISEYEVQNFVIGVAATYGQVAGDFEQSATGFCVLLGYRPTTELMFGGAFDLFSQSFEGDSQEASSSAFFVQYETDEIAVALTYQTEEFDGRDVPSVTEIFARYAVSSDIAVLGNLSKREDDDETNYQLGARYEAAEIEAVASYGARTGRDEGTLAVAARYDPADPYFAELSLSDRLGEDEDSGMFVSLLGGYDVTPQFEVGIGYQTVVGGDDDFEQNAFGVNVGYELSDKADVDFAYFVRRDGDFESTNIALTLTYEVGTQARLAPRIREDFFLSDRD